MWAEGRMPLAHACDEPPPMPSPSRRRAGAAVRCRATAAADGSDLAVADSPESVVAQLSPEQLESWETCRLQLQDAGVPEGDVDRVLAKGFSWTSRAYFGPTKVRKNGT